MKTTSETVIFFGSGPVAAESLRLLLQHQSVEAVITKPATRKDMQVVSGTIPVYTIGTKAELEQLLHGGNFTSDLGILIDFGIIISQSVIDYFPLGIINSHFSLLPELRGADPITFAILSGQKITGVSLMLVVKAMDEGPILATGEQIISSKATTPQLTEQLIRLSDGLLQKAIPGYRSGMWKPASQDDPMVHGDRQPSYSRKLTKTDGVLDFKKPADELEREIRAYADWPKSRTVLAGKEVIVTAAHVESKTEQMPNTVIGKAFVYNKKIYLPAGKDMLVIDRLKPAGKKDMDIQAFLAGHKNLIQ